MIITGKCDVIGDSPPDIHAVTPISLLVIAAPSAVVPAHIISEGQETPLLIASPKFNKGFPSSVIIDNSITPTKGGKAVPNLSKYFKPTKIDPSLIICMHRFGNTHMHTTRINTASTRFSARVVFSCST